MEFSEGYKALMRAFVTSNYIRTTLDGSESNLYKYPVLLTYNVHEGECEVPTGFVGNGLKEGTVVLPLCVTDLNVHYAGADPIIKYFSRVGGYSRLIKVTTPKGEVYYGNCGIIMDKDFNPLLYSTVKVIISANTIDYNDRTIHIHPKVFTNDTGVINKSILRKGIAFFIENSLDRWDPDKKAAVVIDDGSKFFKKVNKPKVNELSTEAFNKILKENIDEILAQFADDNVGSL